MPDKEVLKIIKNFEHMLIDFTDERNRLMGYLKSNDDKLPSIWRIKAGLGQLSDISNDELIAIAKEIANN